MSSDATQKPKPTLDSTDTSRLRAGLAGASPVPPPAAAPVPPPSATAPAVAQSETNSGRLRRLMSGAIHTDTSRLAKVGAPVPPPAQASPTAETTPAMPVPPPAPAPASATVSVGDPLAQRDTNTGRLRRMKVGESGNVAATAAVPAAAGKLVTDTVRLKVQREAKKEGAPSAGQTVRLRPPTTSLETQAGPAMRPAPAPAGTIKVSAPPPAPAAAPSAQQTIRLRSTGGAAAATMPVPPPAEDTTSAQTLKVTDADGSAAQSGKRTLRIRKDGVPSGQAPAAVAGEAVMANRAAAAKAAASRSDTVFNVLSVLNILVIGGFIGVLVWQLMLHIL